MARTLDLVGERWTLLVVRNLLLGPKRYRDLLSGLPGITTNLLAQRLKEMEAAGLVERIRLPAPASADAYDLTPLGRELEPAVHALGAFGQKHLLHEPRRDDRFDPAWMFLSLKRRYRKVMPAVVEVHVGERVFQFRTGGERLEVREERRWDAEATVRGALEPVRDLLLFGEPLDKLLARNALTVEGDADAVRVLTAALRAGPATAKTRR